MYKLHTYLGIQMSLNILTHTNIVGVNTAKSTKIDLRISTRPSVSSNSKVCIYTFICIHVSMYFSVISCKFIYVNT